MATKMAVILGDVTGPSSEATQILLKLKSFRNSITNQTPKGGGGGASINFLPPPLPYSKVVFLDIDKSHVD